MYGVKTWFPGHQSGYRLQHFEFANIIKDNPPERHLCLRGLVGCKLHSIAPLVTLLLTVDIDDVGLIH